jgi:hypothetical protein
MDYKKGSNYCLGGNNRKAPAIGFDREKKGGFKKDRVNKFKQ